MNIMSEDLLLSLGREALFLMLIASLPPLLASLAVGFLVSLFQAATQLQEATLSVVPKLAAAALALIVAGPAIGAQLSRFAAQVLQAVAHVSSSL